MAVRLGSDAATREALRARLRDARPSCPLFDTGRWVQDLENALWALWEDHCSKCVRTTAASV